MKYRHTFIVPYQDVDATRRLRLYSMENYLLNIAGKVADEMGIGIPALLPMNYTWIVTHMNMEMLFLPKHGEEMIVETWIERNAHMLSIRDFRIYQKQADGSEQLVGCAKSVWAVLNFESREIVNLRCDRRAGDPAWAGRWHGALHGLDASEGQCQQGQV